VDIIKRKKIILIIYTMNNNVNSGKNVMPMKGQISSNGGMFSLMRNIYQSAPKTNPENNTEKRGKNTLYQDHSLYLKQKKSRAVGKQSYSSPLSFNGNPTNDVKNAKKRMRSAGTVAPPKKGFV
tara:strand:- start:877 stop:1248 length:372 start_codon:yes stop_codon:yes gene_type:complete